MFTSARLLLQLEENGFGGAGTVRTTNTQREKDEAKSGTKAQKQAAQKGQNRGPDLFLQDIRNEFNKQIPWGQLYSSLSKDGQVLEFAWKDQNVVLFMTTVHSGKETKERRRRRPAETATNARTSRLPFGDQAVKTPTIPKFIDMYNLFMGGVDQTDQLRSYYSTGHRHKKNWKALWHLLLDITLTNAYKIARCSEEQPWGKPTNHKAHRQFNEAVYLGLFEHSERLRLKCGPMSTTKKHPERTKLSDWVHPAPAHEHGEPEVLGVKQKLCLACKYAGRRRPAGLTQQPARKPLGELSVNTTRAKKRRDRVPRSRYGYKLCHHKDCWREHIGDR